MLYDLREEVKRQWRDNESLNAKQREALRDWEIIGWMMGVENMTEWIGRMKWPGTVSPL